MTIRPEIKRSAMCIAACAALGSGLPHAIAATSTAVASADSTAGAQAPRTITADQAIASVTTTGFVDVDGAKVQTIAIKYNVNLKGAKIDLDSFRVWDYAQGQAVQLGSSPGVPVSIHIDDEPHDTDGRTGSGSYVVIKLHTDYQLGAVPAYRAAMAAGITQVAAFTTAAKVTVTASTTSFTNYTVVASTNMQGQTTYTNTATPSKVTLTNVEDYKRFTNDSPTVLGYTPDGAAFHATNCFDEVDGKLHDVDLPYALYVPAGYDPRKKYMLVLHVHDAGALGTDPTITLTESKADANYASERVQRLAKEQGFAGLIVVAPQISQALVTSRDNYSQSAGVPATWQLLDHIRSKYNVDPDRIYASGQSMGGMQVISMAAQRDNYFAAVWPIASQWGSNNALQVPFNGAPYYPSTDATIWTKDAHGKPANYRNWYYMISDDNVLIDDCLGDLFSPTIWSEAASLYRDTTGHVVDIKANRYAAFDPVGTSLADQNKAVRELVAQGRRQSRNDGFGFIWEAYDGGSHFLTWVYAHRLFANYQWLLSQTRQSEMNRRKLDLNKPYVLAPTQLTDSAHLIFPGQNDYFKTFETGSGSEGYNTTFANPQGQILRLPGWTAADEGY
jgi:predicted peptidase